MSQTAKLVDADLLSKMLLAL